VVKKLADGSLLLEQTIESVKVKVSGAGPDADTRVLKQFEGARFQIALDARGKITRLEGYDALIKRLTGDNRANAKLVRALVTEESLRTAAQAVFSFLPPKEVALEESWKTETALPLGPLGSLFLENTFTLAAVEKAGQVAKITYTSRGGYMPPRASDGDRTLRIAGGDLRLRQANGTIIFDVAAGRLQRAQAKLGLEGTLRITLQDVEVDMEIRQEQDQRLEMSKE
jgi:hypothetical protein